MQAPTHLGLVLQELGIGYVQARSPQAFARRRVEVRELLDGRVVVLAGTARIATVDAPVGEFTPVPRRSPHADRPRRPPAASPLTTALDELRHALHPPRGPRRPSFRHPWRVAVQPATRVTHPVRA